MRILPGRAKRLTRVLSAIDTNGEKEDCIGEILLDVPILLVISPGDELMNRQA